MYSISLLGKILMKSSPIQGHIYTYPMKCSLEQEFPLLVIPPST